MLRVIGTFIAAALIIYASYLASKYIGKGLGRGTGSRYMRLIDQITLGQDRHMAIVQIGCSWASLRDRSTSCPRFRMRNYSH